MPTTTRIVGLVLMILGIASYWLTGRTSVTALIPAFFGVVFVVLAYYVYLGVQSFITARRARRV